MAKHKITETSLTKSISSQSLTFEQAIQALDDGQDLYIDAPIDSLCHHLHGSVEREPMQEVLLFMAEQKGWPIYVCKGHDED